MSKKITPFPALSDLSEETLEQLSFYLSEDAKRTEEIMRVRELVENHKKASPRFYSAGTQTGRLSSSKLNTSREPKEKEDVMKNGVYLEANCENRTLKITKGSIYFGHLIPSTGLVFISCNDDSDTVVLPLRDFDIVV